MHDRHITDNAVNDINISIHNLNEYIKLLIPNLFEKSCFVRR